MNWYLMVLKKYTVFSGRARRKEYWMFFLFNILIASVIVISSLLFNDGSETGTLAAFAIPQLYNLAIVIPSLAVTARRLHDIGKSGWFMLVALIPFIGIIWLFILLCTDSQYGDNKYGPNPKEASSAISA